MNEKNSVIQNTYFFITKSHARIFFKWTFFYFFVFLLFGIFNTAHATVEIITTASSSPWTAPTNVYSVTVECWGGGGGGFGDNVNDNIAGGGGGGGGYARTVLSVTPSNTYTFSVGTGGGSSAVGNDTTFNTSSCVGAGGQAGTISQGGSGGALNTGDVTYYGGTGADPVDSSGTGGGSSAGSASVGTDATSITGATAPTDGGDGGNGNTTGGNGFIGTVPGGGGGGSGDRDGGSETGGSGAAGRIRLTYTVTVPDTILSGTIYSDEGSTQITSGKTINVAVGTTTTSLYSTTTSSGSGAWSLTIPSGHTINASTPIAIWVDASTTLRAALFTKASTTNSITGLDLYQNRVIVSHEGTSGTSTTNANMSFYDGDDDSDIQYTSNSGTLTVNKGQELHIKTGKVYAPGGAVTINGNASSGTDGSFHIPTSSTYTAGGLTTIAGNLTASSSATFTTHASGITFTATTTGKVIDVSLTTLGDVTFDGSGGGWSFTQTTATTTNFTITNGSVVAPTNLFVSDNYGNAGTFTHNNGTVHFNGTVASNISGNMIGSSNSFNHLAFSGAGSKYFFSPASTTSFVIEPGTGEVSLPTGTLSISGSYSNAANNFTPNGVINFNGTSAQTISPGTPSLGAVTFSGAGTKTFVGNATTTNFTVNSGATVIASSSLMVSGNFTNNGNFQGTVPWTARAAAQTNSWTSVTYGNGTFVAVADASDISLGSCDSILFTLSCLMTSPDGITWTARTASEANSWTSATYGNGLFVAVSSDGTNRVMTSPDGITWSPQSAAEANSWTSVTYGNGLFVAVSSDETNRVMTSPDGITWSPQSAAAANSWQSVTYGNGKFVAVAATTSTSTAAMTSPDGITWSPQSAAAANSWQSVTYGNGLFVAVSSDGTNRVMTSPDGITWTARTASEANSWTSATYGNGLFVAVATDSVSSVCDSLADAFFCSMTSPDGVTWTTRNVIEANQWTSATYGNGLFVAVSSDGTNQVMTSQDSTTTFNGTSAQAISGTLNGGTLRNVAFSGVGTKTFSNNASTTNFVVNSGATVVAPTLLAIAGNYANNGTFTAGSGTTTLNGSVPQIATGTMTGSSAFNTLEITNTRNSSTTSQAVSFNASASTTDTLLMHAGTSAQFLANATSTFQSILLSGTSSQYATLRSSASGTPWALVVPGTQKLVRYVNVKDSHACSGNPEISAVDGTSVDAGGNTCWNFSAPASSLTLSGTIYSDEGSTQITSAKTINVAVGTTTTSLYSTTTNAGTGAWSLIIPSGHTIVPSTPITIWVDASTTLRAALFTKASTTNSITGLDLYQDRVIVSHEGTSGTSTTNASMSFYDGNDDTDIQYTSNSGTLTVNKGQELHIKTGKTYAPGGDVTINGNAGSGTDGSFHLPASATYTAGGLTTIAGNFTASSSATFTTYASGLTFSATTTGKTIDVPLVTLGTTTFNGSGGEWTFGTTSTTSNLTISSGTLVAPATTLVMTGNYENAGSFIDNGGTVKFYIDGVGQNQTISGTMNTPTTDFATVIVSNEGCGCNTSATFSNNASTTNLTLIGGTGMELIAPEYLSISGNYTNNGKFTHNSGTTTFNGTSAQTATGTMISDGLYTSAFNNLVFTGAGNKTLVTNASSTNFTVDSTATVIAPSKLSISGNFINNGLFTDNSGTVIFNSGSAQTISGTMNTATTDFATTTFTGAGVKTFSNNASTTNFTINSGATVVAPSLLSIAGNYANSGTATFGSGTTTLGGSSAQTLAGTLTGTSAFNNLTIANTSGAGSTTQSVIFSGAASTTGTLTMNPSTSAQFLANASTTFQNIALNGAAGQNVYLRSSNQNTKYSFYVPGTQTLTYTDVKDSSACPGSITASLATNINSGNNSCWSFAAAQNIIIASTAHQTFTYGQATTTISSITITDDTIPTITAANDIRIKIATSTVRMLFDTTDTTVTLGGTAAGKVSTTVSYEGNGSVLVLAVDTNFDASDTLTIDGLSYTQFTAVNAAATALGVYTGGASDIIADDTDDKTVAITGSLALFDHTSGQINDGFTGTANTGVPLYAFNLASTTGETATVSSIVFKLSEISAVISSDLTNLLLYRDMNSNQSYDAGDVAVGGSGVVSINGQLGTITFSTSFSATSSKDYLLVGDYTAVHAGDSMTVSLPTVNITATGVITAVTLTVSGSSDSIEHQKGGQSNGGGGSEVGGSAPQGASVETGGGSDGGIGGVGSDTGEQLGTEPGFEEPTTTGSPLNQWTSGSNGYASDGAYTTAATNGFRQSYGTFGFSIPSNNQITGIEVKFEGSASTAAGTISARLSWDGGSSVTSLKTTGTLTTSDVVYSLGGPSDTWGRAWSVAEFSNSNFTIELLANTNSNTVQVDAIQVRVYHQASGGGGGGGGGAEVSIPSNRFFASVYSAGGVFWNGLLKHIFQWLWVS